MTSLTKNPHHQPKNFLIVDYNKTCHIFLDFDQVCSIYRTREIPTQNHMCLKVAGCKSVKVCPTQFSRCGKKFCKGGKAPLVTALFIAVVFNQGVTTPMGLFALFLWVARASNKDIHNYFYILYFLYGTTFYRSQNKSITWQKRYYFKCACDYYQVLSV